ncbi:hypothetical protein BAUCODRAFT_125082 [Baudoinia panamericana UAMH 10762]|uniref:Uncharacterized protein n=1 Tax=Baudoinia panamericana (strain UAMH 10762) TaxID=717646 RepID=M2M9T1_BAUPA|nr:uncharacterized protein BAUCODRAFT_125082 [Baudoinia panamericana UAMH 10762]EMC93201.1 hypothetical protein BAUCODRAFT_125082 [Baudoinia panamericana UAMH 10762]
MDFALQEFCGRLGRLTAEADRLRDERGRLEARKAAIDERLAEVDAASRDLASSYGASGPRNQTILPHQGDRTFTAAPTPADTTRFSTPSKDVENTEPDGDNNIIVASPKPKGTLVASSKMIPGRHPILHELYPTIVNLDGIWTEIWCGRCSLNWNTRSQTYFHGVDGLHNHWMQAHKSELHDSSLKACLKEAGRRSVSDIDGTKMKLGEAPVDVLIKPRGLDTSSNRVHARKSIMQQAESPPQVVTLHDTSSSKSAAKKITEYEVFQNLAAEAEASATPKAKRQRTSAGRPSYFNGGRTMSL